MSDTKTCFKKVDYDLSALLNYIEIGDIGLPDIQRPFVWSNAKVRDLFDSMYRGFPVGYLLFWENAHGQRTKQIGTDPKGHPVPSRLIVDGQQRLTSLYAVLRGRSVLDQDYRQRTIEIAFRPRDGRFDVADAAIRRDPDWIPNISTLWATGKASYSIVKEFLNRAKSRAELSDEAEEQIAHNLDRLFDLQKYPFTALEIASTVPEEQVSDIFVRINSEGVRLNQADFILTLMSVHWDEGRAALEAFCRAARQPTAGTPSPYNHFVQPDPDQLLRVSVARGFRRARLEYVYSLLRGKDLETGEFSDTRRDEQFEVLRAAQSEVLDLQTWHEFLKAVNTAGFRRANMITSKLGLLYSYALFLIGRRHYGVEPFRLRCVMARWFFMTTLTSRYSGNAEGTMEQDLARLRSTGDADSFVQVLDEIIAQTLPHDYWTITLPGNLATSSGSTPPLFAYYAALVLLDAKVLFSNLRVADLLDPTVQSTKSSIERHHLFPRGYLATRNIKEVRETNQIANFALVEWADNLAISDEPPADYLPRYAARLAAQNLADMAYWHALPDGWVDLPYEEFLAARRQLIAAVIRDGFQKL
ncbi:MAG: DUF262 domain-containing protein, partial [Armatimonadetes bacterium]|nr:DUF262 domain-containing protein [Armatimonadota bacterium]